MNNHERDELAKDYAKRCGMESALQPGFRVAHPDDIAKAMVAFLKEASRPAVTGVEVERDFWRDEYKRLAEAGVERLRDYGVEADPASKMVDAAEYRLKKTLKHADLPTQQVTLPEEEVAVKAMIHALDDFFITADVTAQKAAARICYRALLNLTKRSE